MELLLQGEFLTYTIITILVVSAVIYFSGPRILYVILALCVLIDVNIYYLKGIFDLGLLKVALFLPFFLFYGWKFRFSTPTGFLILLWLIYTFSLTFLSSDFMASLANYAKMMIGMLMFPAAFILIKRKEDIGRFVAVGVIAIVIIGLNLLIAQFIDLGLENAYLDQNVAAIRFGGGVSSLSYLLVFGVLLASIKYQHWEKQQILSKLLAFLLFAAVIMVFLYFRRAPILALLLSGSYIFLRLGKKELLVKLYLVGFLASLILLVILYDYIALVLATRFQDVGEGGGRFVELFLVAEDYFSESVKHTLFGSEFLNSAGYYYSYFGYGRQLHTDFAQVFHGSGLLGFIIYFSIFISLFLYRNYCRKNIPEELWPKRLDAVFHAVLGAHLLFAFSGSINFLTYQAFLFFLLGGILSVYRNLALSSPNGGTR